MQPISLFSSCSHSPQNRPSTVDSLLQSRLALHCQSMSQHQDPTIVSSHAQFSGSSGPYPRRCRNSQNCERLQNLAPVLGVRKCCAPSQLLLHLCVGHSNVNDPLHTTILLSHLALLLESLKRRIHQVTLRPVVGWQIGCPISRAFISWKGPIFSDMRLRDPRWSKVLTPYVVKKTYLKQFAHVRPKTVEWGFQLVPSLLIRWFRSSLSYFLSL